MPLGTDRRREGEGAALQDRQRPSPRRPPSLRRHIVHETSTKRPAPRPDPGVRPRRTREQPPADLGSSPMTTIGLIGSGHIGSTVARLAVDAGYDVVLSNSRGPETLQDLVTELGPRARAATAEDAAAAGDVVVVTVPLKNYRQVPVAPLAGKVVIDTNNYYPERDDRMAELDDESTTVSELLQDHLPSSHVVKAFNNIFFGHLASLARPAGDPERSVLAIAGDDEGAKATVTEVLDRLGYDAHDAARRGLALPARHRGLRRAVRRAGRGVPGDREAREPPGDGGGPGRCPEVRRPVGRAVARRRGPRAGPRGRPPSASRRGARSASSGRWPAPARGTARTARGRRCWRRSRPGRRTTGAAGRRS